MAQQTSIDQYFNIRKIGAVDEINKVSNRNKVLVLDKNISDPSKPTLLEVEEQLKKILFIESPKVVNNSGIATTPKLKRSSPKTTSSSKKHSVKQNNKSDVRKYLLHYFEESSAERNENEFKELHAKLLSNPLLARIKNKIYRSNELLDELKEDANSKTTPKSPSLEKFNTIDIELSWSEKQSQAKKPGVVHASYDFVSKPDGGTRKSSTEAHSKSLQKSPSCLMSPRISENSNNIQRKLLTETSQANFVPAYVRCFGLSSGKGLVLPHKFRSLAETFRSVDAVVSLLFNRCETIYFSKLKASVELMSKRNLTETHLGQIHSLCPDMFSFKQEKLKHLPGQSDKYELVVTPVFQLNNGTATGDEIINSNEMAEKTCLMTPSVLLDRKRKLYLALLEKTKDYHEDFISTLNPPFIFNRAILTRWHPEFNLDGVPDIMAVPLPQPPYIEKCSSAKDVLSKARDMFICNSRMEKALEKVSTTSKESIRSSPTEFATSLKGIPKSLLERVRAKQAAKRIKILIGDPQWNKQRTVYSRLPEIARIVNNTFVGEKRNVLSKTLLLSKLSYSYREILSPNSMEHHLTLLINSSSGWLSTVDYKNETFYKIVKDTELSLVLQSIQDTIHKL